MTEEKSTSESSAFDPVYENTRRETLFIIGAWVFFCVWVVGVSVKTGYNVDPDTMTIVMGMPAWVFWGVALPWLASNVFIVWFALKYMADDPLGEDEDESEDVIGDGAKAGAARAANAEADHG